jgi:hypothetical protein
MKHPAFIKEPRPGDIIKVYTGGNSHTFGIFQRIEIGTKTEADDLDEPGQIALLKHTDQEFGLVDCDFMFDDKVVRFI